MSEAPLDKLVNEFYSTIPSSPTEAPRKPTITACLLALDALRKTTDAPPRETSSSIEDLSRLIEKGASQESLRNQACRVAEAVFSSQLFKSATTDFQERILAAYKRAGGSWLTYVTQQMLKPIRRLANWRRYGREEGRPKGRDDLGTIATRLFTEAIRSGVAKSKKPDAILREMRDLGTKPADQQTPEEKKLWEIRGSKDFFQEFLAELDEHPEDVAEWVKALQGNLPEDFEKWAQEELVQLQKEDPKAHDPKARRKIEALFLSKAFAEALPETKRKPFALYKKIGGTCSSDLFERFAELSLAKSDQEVEDCLSLLPGEEVLKECASMGLEAQALIRNRLESVFSSNPFANANVRLRIGLLDLYRTVGGKRSTYVERLVLTCMSIKTDLDGELYAKRVTEVASEDAETKVEVQQQIEQMFSSPEYTTAKVRSRVAAVDVYRTIDGALPTRVWELVFTLTRTKTDEECESCITRLQAASQELLDPEAKKTLRRRLERLFQTNDFVNATILSRVAIVRLYYESLDGSPLESLLALLAIPPKENREEWAKVALECLQKEGTLGVCTDLSQWQKTMLQFGLMQLFESQAFASASADTKNTVLEIYRAVGGEAATYVWEKSCAQTARTASPEALEERKNAISYLRSAINKAIYEDLSAEQVLQQYKEMAGEDQIQQCKDLIQPLLEEERERRPEEIGLLLSAYTPTPVFVEQTNQGLRGSDEEYAAVVQKLGPRTQTNKEGPLWGEQFWIAWMALQKPPIDEKRRDHILNLFAENGFPYAPPYFQNAIMACFRKAGQTHGLPESFKKALDISP
jgi:5-carboxymethyl-2-hydroxymuconate isomerase